MAPGLSPLLAPLLDAGAYPHQVQDLRLVETHMSWVVLTGSYAYKIKKPVRLPFADFSTLERRRHFCIEELRLNRSYAPALYLGVSPIVVVEGGLQVDGAGEPIEYAVRMVQFDRQQELGSILERDPAGADLASFGRWLAKVHAGLPRVSAKTGADAAPVPAACRQNLAELDAVLARIGKEPIRAQVRDWMSSRLKSAEPLLACRWRDGYVRECHGDLHIGNVARLEGRLTAFDCIEFEPKFRWIDVADDAAFLIMDLCANGHGSKAWEFFNAYLEESGDFQGCALTDLYQVHRALVRAKVAALGWAGATGSGGRQSANALERYLGFADWLTRVRAPHWLILATGVSGSGKSTLARSLAARLPAIHLRSDIERKRLAGLAPAARAMAAVDSGIYTDDLTRATYQRLADCARNGLGAGCSVIVDATFLRREQRRLFETIARELGVKLLIVRCVAPESVLRERVALRLSQRNDPSDATLDVLAHQLAIAELLDEQERDHAIEIDTARSATPEALVLDAIGHEPMYRGP